MLVDDLKRYIPYNEQEKKDKEVIISYLNKYDDVFLRTNEIAHFTASSWIVSKDKTKVLMVYHKIYNSWSWTGGHADGDTNLLNVAIKEAKEETGIEEFNVLSKDIYSIEVLPVSGHIKNGKYVASHLHLNVTYLLEADENAPLKIKEDENKGVKWFSKESAIEASSEIYFKENIYPKLNEKLKQKI